jgi:predicted CoA-binding protein
MAGMDDRQRAWDMLDVQEATGPVPLLDDDGVARLLARSRRIAVVGASPHPTRPSHGVMAYLMSQGYDCVPVNPRAREVLGVPAFGDLETAVAQTGSLDIVDVFRRSEFTPEIARSAVAAGASALWLQLGIVDWEAARIAHKGGLEVVMDRCMTIEHRRHRISAIRPA